MSSKCDVSLIDKQIQAADGAVNFESYLIKAAAKAFHKLFPEMQSNVSRIVSNGGVVLHSQAHEQSLSSLSHGELHEDLANFSGALPSAALTVS